MIPAKFCLVRQKKLLAASAVPSVNTGSKLQMGGGTMPTLLLIDDDREMLEITSASFHDKGYQVRTAENAAQGLRLLASAAPDCVILDVMMPGMDGFETCKKIRETSAVPIIFLSGRVSEEDKVTGLSLSGDDYVEKPFGFRELEARVQAAIRRSAPTPAGVLSFPPLEINVAQHRVSCNGEELNLTAREYSLLYLLASSGGKAIPYEEIGVQIWGSYRIEDRGAVMVVMSRLRKKLEGNPVTARMIETVWSTGYKFTGKKGKL